MVVGSVTVIVGGFDGSWGLVVVVVLMVVKLLMIPSRSNEGIRKEELW